MPPTVLTTDQRATLDRAMAQPEHSEARKTIWELIGLKDQRAAEVFPWLRRNYQFDGIPDEELMLASRLGQTAGDGLFMPDCLLGGIVRRFLLDSPLELALRLAFAARYEWLQTRFSPNTHPEELFRPLLQAAAAHDCKAVARIVETAPEAIEHPNNRDYALLLSALVGLAAGDDARLRRAAEAMQKRKPYAYVKAIQRAMIGIAEGSADGFADALTRMLAAYPRYMYDDEIYGLVDPHTIGLFELCRMRRPEVVDAFDTCRGLPWDTGYHAWLLTVDDIAAHFDIGAVPDTVRPYLLDLNAPSWAEGAAAV